MSSSALLKLFERKFGFQLKGVRDVNQLDVRKPDQEVQEAAVLPWNISEKRCEDVPGVGG